MKRAPIHRATAAVCATAVTLGGLALGGTARAAPTGVQPMFSYADGWGSTCGCSRTCTG